MKPHRQDYSSMQNLFVKTAQCACLWTKGCLCTWKAFFVDYIPWTLLYVPNSIVFPQWANCQTCQYCRASKKDALVLISLILPVCTETYLFAFFNRMWEAETLALYFVAIVHMDMVHDHMHMPIPIQTITNIDMSWLVFGRQWGITNSIMNNHTQHLHTDLNPYGCDFVQCVM